MAGTRLVHEQEETIGDGEQQRTVLATEVEIADSVLANAKGLMFRSELPDDFALVLEVGGDSLLPIPRGPPSHLVHMLFVQVPLDVIWLVDDTVTKTAQMQPWRSVAVGKADRILELPAGAADDVKPGDTILIEDGEDVETGEQTETISEDSAE
jgi:uncharacterized membrane protein (UPF0127 family)